MITCPFCGTPSKDDRIFIVQIDSAMFHCRCYDCGEEWVE